VNANKEKICYNGRTSINGSGKEKLAYLIRPMEKGDLGQVNEIDREAFPSQWPPPNYRHELQNRLAHYLVAIDDTRTITEGGGKTPNTLSKLAAWLAPWRKTSRTKDETPSPRVRQYIVGFTGIWLMVDEAHITNIAVAQEYRRRGIGELLLIATIDLAQEFKANTMTLEVRASNIAAQNLYNKYGFMKIGVRRGYYLDNKEDAVIMSTENINSEPFQTHIQKLREVLAMKLV
jgi:ribosomal-protein-alanine N-acetyltransferase